MTLEELRAYDKAFITPGIAAEFLGCSPHWIRLTARNEPEKLNFPVQLVGSRTKIPKEGFIRFMEGAKPHES